MITIQGKPKPKKGVKRGKFKNYNPSKKDMDDIQWIIKSQYTGKLLTGAVKLDVTYYMPIPKSMKKVPKWHIKRPDEDNLTKMIKDCMSGIVYKDDSQVCDAHYKKIYSVDPRTEIIIEEI